MTVDALLLAADAEGLTRYLADNPEAASAAVGAAAGSHRALVDRIARLITTDSSIPLVRSPAHRPLLDVALAAGADPSAADDQGWTALHTVAFCGDTELCTALLAAGANPRSVTSEGAVPLHLALFYGHHRAAALLALEPPSLREAAGLGDVAGLAACFDAGGLRSRASVRSGFYRPGPQFPAWERTLSRQELLDEALAWGARSGQIEAMAELVQAGAHVDANVYRGTATLWATYGGQNEAIRWLAQRGADLSLPHDFGGSDHGHGATAMHLAAQFGNIATLEVLLAGGADASVRDAQWQGTPREWAAACDQPDAAQWLADRGH